VIRIAEIRHGTVSRPEAALTQEVLD